MCNHGPFFIHNERMYGQDQHGFSLYRGSLKDATIAIEDYNNPSWDSTALTIETHHYIMFAPDCQNDNITNETSILILRMLR